MFVLSNEKRLRNLEVGEYFFLTENLEFTNQAEIENGVRFLVSSKRNNLVKTVQDIIENELDNTERAVIKMYFYDCLDTLTISKKCNISRSSVYRNIKNGLVKIETYVKYVLRYDGYCSMLSADELIREVKGAVH